MSYVDGFVAAVPTANRQTYKTHVEAAAVVFKEHGALSVVECWVRRRPRGQGHVVSDGGPAQTRGDGGLLLDRLAVPRGTRCGNEEGARGSAHAARCESDALRCDAPDLWRLRSDPRHLTYRGGLDRNSIEPYARRMMALATARCMNAGEPIHTPIELSLRQERIAPASGGAPSHRVSAMTAFLVAVYSLVRASVTFLPRIRLANGKYSLSSSFTWCETASTRSVNTGPHAGSS
jgi:hypothetical protein